MSDERPSSALSALDANYDIIRQIGIGGTAVVYLARQRETDEDVAIKVIRAAFIDDPEAMARFEREARLAARLDHPNIVAVRDVVPLADGRLALVMPHVPGRTLKEHIREHGRLSAEYASSVLRDIASALGAAHAKNIIHRDVKPENIFIEDGGRALLADFGLARSTASDASLTMVGVAIGTPSYMPPEQIDDAVLDPRGDIYSLGLVAWEMLTGKRPWDGDGLYALLYHQKYDYLPDVREFRDDVPDRLAEVIARAIQKAPDARWHSTKELIAALDGGAVAPCPPPRLVASDTVRIPRAAIARETAAIIDTDETPRAAKTKASVAERLEAVRELASTIEPPERRRRLPIIVGVLGAAATLVLGAYWVHAVFAPANDEQFGALKNAQATVSTVAARPDSTIVSTANAAPTTTRTDSIPTRTQFARGGDVAPPQSLIVAPQGERASSKQTQVARAPTPAPVPVAATASSPALVIPAPSPTTTVVAGGSHSCLMLADARLYCWGANGRGQLGTNSTEASNTPARVKDIGDVTSVAAGTSHSCAIVRDGGAWCWGSNDHGQLGDKSNVAHALPWPVAEGHAFRAIAAGASHSCALDASGTAWCWGSDSVGQLGDGNRKNSNIPVAVASGPYASLAVGSDFTCALDEAGHAYCWGANKFGQLGTHDDVDRIQPTLVSSELTFLSIATGAAHTCGIATDSYTYCWGDNASGQLGDGTTERRTTPTHVSGGARFTSITAGATHTCGLDVEHRVQCWGSDVYGQLGIGDGSGERRLRPILVMGQHAFASVHASSSHTCGATLTGEVLCWGYNLNGQLGDGTQINRSMPVRVDAPPR